MKTLKKATNKIPLTIHPAFIAVLLYYVVFGNVFAFIVISSLALIHEVGHAIIAGRYGYKLKKIRLLPFGAELCGNDLFVPAHEIKIAIAGPATNFTICLLCFSLMWLFPCYYALWQLIFDCSLTLCLFNLLPFFPLDGGRVFVALISARVGRDNSLKTAKILTFLFGLVLLILFVISLFSVFNLSFGIMGISLILSVLFISPNSKYERFTKSSAKQKKLQTGLLQKHIAISCSASIISAFSNVDARSQTVFCVQNENGKEIIRLSESDIETAITSGAAYKKIGEYFVKNH